MKELVLKVYNRKQRDELSRQLLENKYEFVDWNYEYDLFENAEGHRIRVLIIR